MFIFFLRDNIHGLCVAYVYVCVFSACCVYFLLYEISRFVLNSVG